MNSPVNDLIKKVFEGELLNEYEIGELLRIPSHSLESGIVIGAADKLNRQASNNLAEVHAQIGLNCSKCYRNCSFCAFAAKYEIFKEESELSVEDAVKMAHNAEAMGANALFIMATGDYSFNKYLEISKEIRSKISKDTVMIANVGDFNLQSGKELRDAGYLGIYHAVRMGEGKETRIKVDTRLQTVKNAEDSGLLIGTCVEPIGPEHGIDEIVEKILIGRNMNPCYSGAMRRINIPGSDLEKYGMLSEYRAAFIVAVTRLAMGIEVKGNCTHEPNLLGASSGANLFWAEVGTNPRDTKEETSEGRGIDINICKDMFKETDYDIFEGASIIYT